MFDNETITITRYATGTYIDGHYVRGISIASTGYADIQPLAGKELLLLPEGEREKEAIKIFTDSLSLKNKDVVIKADNKTYEVQMVKNWMDHVIPHYRAVATLIEGQES